MAAGAGFKTFNTGDVLSASDVNSYLMSQTVMVFADAAARTSAIASPQEGMISFLKDTNSTEYYSGSAWAAVGAGGGGKVLQVVQSAYSSAVTTTSGTFVNSGFTVSITPSASTSKILIMTSFNLYTAGRTDVGGAVQITRASGGTIVYPQNALYTHYVDGVANSVLTQNSMQYLDSPATTSALTYELQYRQTSGSGTTAGLGFSNQTTTLIALEIGA